jgi:hypothetical protein
MDPRATPRLHPSTPRLSRPPPPPPHHGAALVVEVQAHLAPREEAPDDMPTVCVTVIVCHEIDTHDGYAKGHVRMHVCTCTYARMYVYKWRGPSKWTWYALWRGPGTLCGADLVRFVARTWLELGTERRETKRRGTERRGMRDLERQTNRPRQTDLDRQTDQTTCAARRRKRAST